MYGCILWCGGISILFLCTSMMTYRFPKMSEVLAVKDKYPASSGFLAAIKNVLMPPTLKKGNNPTVLSTLNKLTAQNYAKLAPYVVEHANAEAIDILLEYTIKQNVFCDLYVTILKDIHKTIDTQPHIAAYVTETHQMIRNIHSALVMSQRDEYNAFCDVIKNKQCMINRVKTIVKINKLIPCTSNDSLVLDIDAEICGQIKVHKENEFSTETLIDMLAELDRTDEHTRICKELLLKKVSFKLKFKVENLTS